MQDGPRYLTNTDIYNLTTTQQDQLGAKGVTADGREYRYVKFGGTSTINSGLVLVAAAVASNSTGLAIPTTNSTAALSSGSTSFVVTNGATAVTQDQFAEGFVEVLGTNGVQTYRLKGNTAAGNAGAITLFLAEPLRNTTALANGTNTVNLTKSIYDSPVATLTKSAPVGVTIMPVANTASVTNYGWVQTKGHGFVSATTATKGQPVAQDTAGTAGFAMSTAAATDYQIGVAKESAASSTAPVELNLA